MMGSMQLTTAAHSSSSWQRNTQRVAASNEENNGDKTCEKSTMMKLC